MAKRKSTIGLIWRTKPFVGARLAVFAVFFFATIGFIGSVVWSLRLFESHWPAQLSVIVVSVSGYLLGRSYLRRYLTYIGQAPHIMAMVDAIKGTKIEKGERLVDVSTRRVESQFTETSRLYRLEGLLYKGLAETRAGLLAKGSFRPLPAFAKLGKVASWILRWSLGYVRDAILAFVFFEEKTNVWRSARRGMVLYSQSQERMAKTAVRVFFIGVLFGLVMIGLLLIPTLRLLGYAEDPGLFTMIVLFAGLAKAAWVLKGAIYEPVALAYVVPRFLRVFDETELDEAEAERLDEVSKRFRELSLRARNFSGTEQLPAKRRADRKRGGETPSKKPTRKESAKAPSPAKVVGKAITGESVQKTKKKPETEPTDASVILDELGDLPELDEEDGETGKGDA